MVDDQPSAPLIFQGPSSTRKPSHSHGYPKMRNLGQPRGGSHGEWRTKDVVISLASYASDWIVLAVFGVVGWVLGELTPNKRPFSLEDPGISFPFAVHETVPASLAFVINTAAPIVVIIILTLVFVPGGVEPRTTPKALVWRRKLWELHAGLLGLGLSAVAAWFITNAMKNMFGKPRPDLISRCQPDLANLNQYIVGGIANMSSNGQLVSGDICKNPDKSTLDDGFRSFPSGHSSSSAAGLFYLTLFMACKFAVTLPLLGSMTSGASAFRIFFSPSHQRESSYHNFTDAGETYELRSRSQGPSTTTAPLDYVPSPPPAPHPQPAAPPLYILAVSLVPLGAAVFIAGSRWVDHRHHAFDILFGFFTGLITAVVAFRYYHPFLGPALPPRSRQSAFWPGDEEAALDTGAGAGAGAGGAVAVCRAKGWPADQGGESAGPSEAIREPGDGRGSAAA